MLINIVAAKLSGIEAISVTVEVDVVKGIGIHLVGLADTAIKESLMRTITSLQFLGYHIPGKKIVINLAPADLQKKGSCYDVPIALAIIAASGQKEFIDLDKYLIMGELGLDGGVRSISGALSIVEMAAKKGLKACILPYEAAMEAKHYQDIKIYAIKNLSQAIDLLCEKDGSQIHQELDVRNIHDSYFDNDSLSSGFDYPDFEDIIGQDFAKRGLEIAVAGRHNVLMIGSPGSGKSSLAKAMQGIMSKMSEEEAYLTSKIYSASSLGHKNPAIFGKRPFRSPHHSASLAALLGGGTGDNIQAGEVSLAHNGILFIDEYCQAPKHIIEGLRAPLEDRKIVISRLKNNIEFPASFIFIAATNPCPCGYYGEEGRCVCSSSQRMNYLSKLSGPILDRIDVQLWVNSVSTRQLAHAPKGESSAVIAKRVEDATAIQHERFKNYKINNNSEIPQKLINKFCPLSDTTMILLEELSEKNGLSARAFFRIIKISRTIADLAASDSIKDEHIIEAMSYRSLDKMRINKF